MNGRIRRLVSLCLLSSAIACDEPAQSSETSLQVSVRSAPTPLNAQPVVLSREQLRPLVEACVTHRSEIEKAFGTSPVDLAFELEGDASPYESSCQGFALPNGRTVLAFGTLGNVGAIVFDSSTHAILDVRPWSRVIESESKEPVMYDRVFYRLHQDSAGEWHVTAHVFAIVGHRDDTRFETWEFTGQGHGRRYTMMPLLQKGTSATRKP